MARERHAANVSNPICGSEAADERRFFCRYAKDPGNAKVTGQCSDVHTSSLLRQFKTVDGHGRSCDYSGSGCQYTERGVCANVSASALR